MSENFGCNAIFFRETPEGHVQDFHNAPRRQLIFLTSGILELEASDGERTIACRVTSSSPRTCRAGPHHPLAARVRGFVHVPMPDDFDLTAWPLIES